MNQCKRVEVNFKLSNVLKRKISEKRIDIEKKKFMMMPEGDNIQQI